jgi:hypothetical protein
MNRKDFLKVLGTGIVALAVPSIALGKNDINYPLTSTPDLGTQLDETKALKARKLAKYVILKDNQNGLLSYNPNHGGGKRSYQGVEAVMSIDGQRYTVLVLNANEASERPMRDLMSFWVRPEGTHGQKYLTTFSDEGLNGICDFGIIPEGTSQTGNKIMFSAKSVLRPNGEGLEHAQIFQKLYENTLDTLIKFYEAK